MRGQHFVARPGARSPLAWGGASATQTGRRACSRLVALFSTTEIIMHSGRCRRLVGKMLGAGGACRRGEEAFRHLGSEGGLSRRHPVTLQGGWGVEGTQKDRPRGREGGAYVRGKNLACQVY